VYGLLKKYFFCHPRLDPGSSTVRFEYKFWIIFPGLLVYASFRQEWQSRRI